MKLSDVVSHSGLSVYAEVALILFMVAFLAIVFWLFRPGRRGEMDHVSRLPLDDDPGAPQGGARPQDDPAHGAGARRRANG